MRVLRPPQAGHGRQRGGGRHSLGCCRAEVKATRPPCRRSHRGWPSTDSAGAEDEAVPRQGPRRSEARDAKARGQVDASPEATRGLAGVRRATRQSPSAPGSAAECVNTARTGGRAAGTVGHIPGVF